MDTILKLDTHLSVVYMENVTFLQDNALLVLVQSFECSDCFENMTYMMILFLPSFFFFFRLFVAEIFIVTLVMLIFVCPFILSRGCKIVFFS